MIHSLESQNLFYDLADNEVIGIEKDIITNYVTSNIEGVQSMDKSKERFTKSNRMVNKLISGI